MILQEPETIYKSVNIPLEKVNHLYNELAQSNHKVYWLYKEEPNIIKVNKTQRDLIISKLGLTLTTKKVENFYLKATNEKISRTKLTVLLQEARELNQKVNIILTHRSFGRLDFYQKGMILDFIGVHCDMYTELDFKQAPKEQPK